MHAASIRGAFGQLESAGIIVLEHRCVVVRNRHASCRRCARACPTGAIREEEGTIVVEAARCDACGRCAQACPTEALLPPGADVSPAELARELHVQADGTLPHFVPQSRMRLLHDLGVAANGEARWHQVVIDVDRCESCRMCAVFCPTGAIRKFDELDGTFGLEHTPALCVGCRSCMDVCYTGSLSLSDDVSAADVVKMCATRIELQPMRYQRGGPHSATNAIRHILGLSTVYER